MKRNIDATIKKTATNLAKIKQWTPEQDLCLRDIITNNGKEKTLNWKTVCRRLNKQFPTQRVTAKSCENRWQVITSSLTINEELLILLTLHRGKLEVAEELLKVRVDVKDYLVKMSERVLSIVEDIKNDKSLTTIEKLQFFVCVDLALNSNNECSFDLMRCSTIDWLDVVQYLTKQKVKMNKEEFHEFVQKILSNIEDKVQLLLESETDELKEIMHERKEYTGRLNEDQGINRFHPLIGMNFFILASYYRNHPLIN